MKLRCKDGDIALVTQDEKGCEANIGKLVKVTGPVEKNIRGQASWLIEPLDRRLWWCVSTTGALEYLAVTFKTGVDHPDAWLLPIDPETWKTGAESFSETLETV